MKCYVCAKEGKESNAVAVCVSCGMGTCMKHTIRKEVDVWEGSYPLPSHKLPKKMPGCSALTARQRMGRVSDGNACQPEHC